MDRRQVERVKSYVSGHGTIQRNWARQPWASLGALGLVDHRVPHSFGHGIIGGTGGGNFVTVRGRGKCQRGSSHAGNESSGDNSLHGRLVAAATILLDTRGENTSTQEDDESYTEAGRLLVLRFLKDTPSIDPPEYASRKRNRLYSYVGRGVKICAGKIQYNSHGQDKCIALLPSRICC